MNLYISLSQIGQKKKKMIKKIDFAIDFPVCVQKAAKKKPSDRNFQGFSLLGLRPIPEAN